MHKRAGLVVVVAIAASLSTSALAQVAPGGPAASGSAPPKAPATATAPTPGQAQEPAKPDAPAKAPARSAAGYGYSDKAPARKGGVPRARVARGGPSISFPAFAAIDGGGSRLSLQMTAAVQVEEHRAAGSVTYVLKGAHVARRNDTNPLVTVHFNTPVRDARLVPHGADLHLVVNLRAATTATFKVSPGAAGQAGATLEIEFPKGDFLPQTDMSVPNDPPKGGAPKAPEAAPGPAPEPAQPRAPEPKP